jgi:hypothetical protein
MGMLFTISNQQTLHEGMFSFLFLFFLSVCGYLGYGTSGYPATTPVAPQTQR